LSITVLWQRLRTLRTWSRNQKTYDMRRGYLALPLLTAA
jgi:hypothetical protein